MGMGVGTAWPDREALSRLGVPPVRTALDIVMWVALATWALSSAYLAEVFDGWRVVLPPLGLLCCAAAGLAFHRVTVEHRLGASLALLLPVAVLGGGALAAGAKGTAVLLWIVCAVIGLDRLPLAPAVGVWAVLFAGCVLSGVGEPAPITATMLCVLLGGYTLRLDSQARGTGFRLLAQERAARTAEAESAALAERARIAREIHDVLAHSLSAQLVHLEAARLQIERGYDREQVLRRVVAARGMAREGLAETRQALSALRGQVVPVEDYLRELAAADGVRTDVVGEPRLLTAEASQAVRRVAQEAVTNARKHAPGADVWMRLEYGEGEVTLEVRNRASATASTADLGSSGSGYGLLGMRERAELMGGSLEAGPASSSGGGVVAPDTPAATVALDALGASGGLRGFGLGRPRLAGRAEPVGQDDSGGDDSGGGDRRPARPRGTDGFLVRLRVPV